MQTPLLLPFKLLNVYRKLILRFRICKLITVRRGDSTESRCLLTNSPILDRHKSLDLKLYFSPDSRLRIINATSKSHNSAICLTLSSKVRFLFLRCVLRSLSERSVVERGAIMMRRSLKMVLYSTVTRSTTYIGAKPLSCR